MTDPHHGGISRRSFLRSGAAALGLASMGSVLSSCSLPFVGGGGSAPEFPVESPEEALTRLMEGNARFASGASKPINESAARRAEILKRQKPFATVFACIDSRVPPELIFDRGLGDLLVIRTAGEVPDQAVMGSLEYGAFELEIPLLLVLGHKDCTAMKASIELLEHGTKSEGSIEFLTDALLPAAKTAKAQMDGEESDPASAADAGSESTETTVAGGDFVGADTTVATDAAATETTLDPTETTLDPSETTTPAAPSASDQKAADDLLTAAITENVAITVAKLQQAPLIADRIRKDRLMVVGGVYDLETGRVELTVNVPEGFGAAPVKKK